MSGLTDRQWRWSALFPAKSSLWLAFWLALSFQTVPAQTSPASASAVPDSEERHKIQVSDATLAAQIVAQGGRLVADYGSYQLYEAPQIIPGLAGHSRAEIRDEYNVVMLNAGRLDTRRTEVKALRTSVGNFSGRRMHLVQFAGPVQPAWRDELLAAGVTIVTYIPENSYLVYGDAASIAKVQALAANAPHIQWEAPYLDNYKIHPAARTVDEKGNPRQIGTDKFEVQLVDDADANAATLQLLEQLKLAPVQQEHTVEGYVNVTVQINPKNLGQLAAQPDVVSIVPSFPRKKLDERQDQIISGHLTGGSPNVPTGPGYLAWLAGKGFTQAQFDASGFAVDVTDSGIDDGTTTPNHFGLYVGGNTNNASRVIYNRLEGTANPGSTNSGCDGHGNLNSHIIAGYDDLTGFPFADASGFHYGLGVCPFVRVGSSVIFDPDTFTSPNLNTLQSDAYGSGARISNNSWGEIGSDGVYDFQAQNYDQLVRDAQSLVGGNQEMVIVFAAGNDGENGAGTVSSPGSAKNVLTVGASENVQAFGGADRSGVDDSGADNADDIIFFSSRGPCLDGRHKPEIVAPGTHVSGGVAQAPNPGPDGTANPCFTGSGVSGGPNGSVFFPLGQQFYTASSGTSHSTPCVAGACALVRQYFINNFTNAASPAMTKAFLVNSARYLTGASAGDTLWSNNQGMGELNVGTAFDGTARIVRDEVAADLFTASGQTRVFTGVVTDTSKPFRVTLAWTDAPGSTTGNAYNNNLDLTVSVNGQTYKGNVFVGAFSTTGGSADLKNNVESVFLPAGVSGNFVVTVAGASINSAGVPNPGHVPEQDFALVIYNGSNVPLPALSAAGLVLNTETCLPTNGAVDPGETVTMSFSLKNAGAASTSNLVATLLAGSGVTSPGAPQTYGIVTAGGAAVSLPFTFTANGACGATINPTLQLQEGPANLGTVTFNLALGALFTNVTTFSENFDEVTQPALPAGWSSTASGVEIPWVTSSGNSSSPPNSAFVPDRSGIGLSELVSPPIPIRSTNAQLTFKNFYNLEASGSSGFDGGVLEIQIGNGAFNDILAAGGTFAAGGYNRTISSSFGNPLGGRAAWSGNSHGFITTTVNLPGAAAGQNIVLKWRCGTDNSGSAVSWSFDSLAVVDGFFACCSGSAPVITAEPTNETVAEGNTTVFQVTAMGTPSPTYQWFFNTNTALTGQTSNILTLTNVQPGEAGAYSVTVNNAGGSTNSAVAMLAVLVQPTITSIAATGTNVTLSLPSLIGLNYTLEYTDSLDNPVWTPIAPAVPGTGGAIVLQDPNPSPSSRYYRVSVD